MAHTAFVVLALGASACAQPDLSAYFGFVEPRTVVVDDGCGPLISADMNADGRPDLVIVNNAKSRIEIHLLRAEPRSLEETERAFRANQLRPSPWYDRTDVSVAHRVGAVRAYDATGDGLMDLVYAGSDPQEIVVLRQEAGGTYQQHARKRARDLNATQSGFRIADLVGDGDDELIALLDGEINAFGFTSTGLITDPVQLGAAKGVVAVFPEDFDGDGASDLLGVVPENESPLRLWLREGSDLGAELRFEMPALIEVQDIRFPGRDAASIGVIERASRRMVFYDLAVETVDELAAGAVGTERDAQAEVTAFPGDASDRSVATGDLDGDGTPDLVATDPEANALVVYSGDDGRALGRSRSFSSFKEPKVVAMGQWTGSGAPEVFVLSEEEKAVGISSYEDGRLGFPQAQPLSTPGATPVSMGHMTLGNAPSLGIVVKDRRDLVLEVHRNVAGAGESPSLEIATFKLEGARRDPGAILGADADQDGHEDVLVLTPGEPMIMVRADAESGELDAILTKDDMKQFGLVQAAGPDNTALFDMDEDGTDELLIADANFVRACVYDDGGWRVVEQVNASDPTTSLGGVALLELDDETLIVGADTANNRLIFFARDASGQWGVRHRVRMLGFPARRIRAGQFTGAKPSILALSDDGFAIMRLSGERAALEQFAAYRPDAEDRLEHEMEAGDLNGDGYVDLVVLDAKEQMSSIFTFSAARKLYLATEFEVFESRLFTRGSAREYEPSAALIADLTGDGKDDLALVVHDRVIVLPQMTEETVR